MPHLHLRGVACRYTAHYPDGTSEVLLDIPTYNFNWQISYEYHDGGLKRLPAGTRVEFEMWYDNSAGRAAAIGYNHARPVAFGGPTWDEMDLSCEDYLIERWAGMSVKKFWTMDSEEAKPLFKTIVTEAPKAAPWPTMFPFSRMWIAYGTGVLFSREALDTRQKLRRPDGEGLDARPEIVSGAVIAHLVTDTGYVYEFARYDLSDGTSDTSMERVRHPDFDAERGHWHTMFDTTPWIIPTLIQMVNENRTFVLETTIPDFPREFKRTRKQLGIKGGHRRHHIPPPFYTVTMRSKIVREKKQDFIPGLGRQRTYRSDVREHERVRVQRGKLPLDPKTRAKLEKPRRGGNQYRIYTLEPLSPSDAHMLATREIPPKRSDEWLAILVTVIEEHVSPANPELPYVPGLRRLEDDHRSSVDAPKRE